MHDEIAWAVRHVLSSPARLRFLFGDGPLATMRVLRFMSAIVPHARLELEGVASLARSIHDETLRHQALASIDAKAYHVAGACILATFLPQKQARAYVELVAPLESIYDYLDNLCDRTPGVRVDAYPILHRAIENALDPYAPHGNYYASGPRADDNGYLLRLVTRVQRSLMRVEGHREAASVFSEASRLYGEMQTYKHYPPGERERACIDWFERRRDARSADLYWYEFACAAGSQFQVYAPLFELFAGRPESVRSVYDAYFPAVAALHVLLDSFIDQEEDRRHEELNFAAIYGSRKRLVERVTYLSAQAHRRIAALSDASVHQFVLQIMALFYLTHPKVYAQGLNAEAEALLCALRSP